MSTNFYRKAWDFQVTTSIPCPMCTKMLPESEVKRRQQYGNYNTGYIRAICCSDCFKAFVEQEMKADERTYQTYDKSWS